MGYILLSTLSLLLAVTGVFPGPRQLPNPECLARRACVGGNNPLAVVQRVVMSLQSASRNALSGLYAPNAVIMDDEFFPYRWDGVTAGANWLQAASNELHHWNATAVTMSSANLRSLQMSPGIAHIVAPVSYTVMIDKKPFRETGIFTFILVRADDQWKVSGQNWTSKSGLFNGRSVLLP